jgi:hypothetical protein
MITIYRKHEKNAEADGLYQVPKLKQALDATVPSSSLSSLFYFHVCSFFSTPPLSKIDHVQKVQGRREGLA